MYRTGTCLLCGKPTVGEESVRVRNGIGRGYHYIFFHASCFEKYREENKRNHDRTAELV